MLIGFKKKLIESAKDHVAKATSKFISINPIEQNLTLKWPAIEFLINKSLKKNELIKDISFDKEAFKKVRIDLQNDGPIVLKVESITIKNKYGFLSLEIELIDGPDIQNISVIKQFGLSCISILTGKSHLDSKDMIRDSINYDQKKKRIILPINKQFSSKGILSKIKEGSEARATFTKDGLQIDYPEGINLSRIFKMVS
jgi:hypothetical protein